MQINKMKASGHYVPKTAGENLESMVTELFTESYGKDAVTYSIGTKKDIYNGVDIELYQVPIDITMNPDKDHVEWSDNIVEIPFMGLQARFGVRTGNSYKGFTKFETPVLIVLVDGIVDNKWFYNHLTNIEDSIRKVLRSIVDIGMDTYFDYMDAVTA